MNLTTHHIYNAGLEHPSPRFVCERARAESRMGLGKLVKFFTDDTPLLPDAPCREEIDALIRENARIRAGVAEAAVALAKAFGDESVEE